MTVGTPLRRFGRFLVYWTRRHHPQSWHVRDDAEGVYDYVCSSACKASADEAARRLGVGEPVWSPAEYLRRSLTLFPEVHRSRLRYVRGVYLRGRLESPWRNGGVLADTDVTDLTDEGAALTLARRREETELMLSRLRHPGAPRAPHDDEWGDDGLWPAYVAGAWPDVAPDPLSGSEGRALLDDGVERSALGRLAGGEVPDVRADWLEDARGAFLLARRAASDHPTLPGAVAALARMEPLLVARFGDAWRSPGGAP